VRRRTAKAIVRKARGHAGDTACGIARRLLLVARPAPATLVM
jgi:hypothetical protein